jgi:hypothetical protein
LRGAEHGSKTVPQTTHWQIAQDLSSRLRIAAGHLPPPGLFDDLDTMVLFKCARLRAFC